jgi:hypothetical protein
MAWNPTPQVAVARDAADRLGALAGSEVKQCIVVYITKDNIGVISYGRNRALCDAAKGLADDLYSAAVKHLS